LDLLAAPVRARFTSIRSLPALDPLGRCHRLRRRDWRQRVRRAVL